MDCSLLDDEDEFWSDLRDSMLNRTIIPVVGDGVVMVPGPVSEDGEQSSIPLTKWLAPELAKKLKIAANLPADATLSDVAATYLMANPDHRERVYARLNTVLEEAMKPVKSADGSPDQPPFLRPSSTLLKLAEITHFDLFVSTAFDPLLNQALDQVRHGKIPLTRLISYYPEAAQKETDTPVPKAQLWDEKTGQMTTVLFMALGMAGNLPNYAVWDEDVMEHILALNKFFQGTTNLGADLKKSELLFIGCGFSDWVARFFMRVAEQQKLSLRPGKFRLVADQEQLASDNLVMFFKGLRQNIKVLPCEPVAFVEKLHEKWTEWFPEAAKTARELAAKPAFVLPDRKMATGSVFISYAREDVEAVKILNQGLNLGGCPTWFDLERLQAAVHWESNCEDEVMQRCSVFISVISRTTEREPGYYHTERQWAEKRASRHGALAGFYIPVIIDDQPIDELVREIPLYKSTNITPLPGGQVTTEFLRVVKEMQERNRR